MVRDALILGLAVSLFLALSLQNITLPGLYYDEALDVLPAMQLLQGAPVEAVRGAAVTIGGRSFPLMVMDYVGAVNTALALPVFAVFGVSVTSVRLLPILLAALSLALGYRLACRLFDWRVAAVTTLLVAVDPSYVFFSRMGNHVTSVMTVFALGSVLAFLRWRETRRMRWLALGGLLLGLGLWAKVLFLWWIIALAVAWFIMWRVAARPAVAQASCLPRPAGHDARPTDGGDAGHDARWSGAGSARPTGEGPAGHDARPTDEAAGYDARPTARQALVVLMGIVIGSAPLWVYNLMSGGTLIAFGRNAVVTESGVNNLNVLGNLAAAVQSFAVLLDGRYFWFMGGQFANRANVLGFAAALLVSVVLVRRRPQWQGALGLVVTLIVVIVVESAFTVSGIWATHLYILLPLPQVVMAVALVLGADSARSIQIRLQPLIIVLVLAGLMLASLQVDASYEAAVEQSRGLSRFSDAIYRLADWLEARPGVRVYAVDWGISKNVQVLTQGRVNPIDISGYAGESEVEFTRRATEALADPAALYIFHSREDTVYERYAWFQATAERMGVRIKIIDATRDQSGAPVHVIWARQ